MIYLIVIENRSRNFDYAALYDKIKSLADDYIQAMDCLWFIYCDKQLDIKETTKELSEYIGLHDLLFMSELPYNVKKEGRLLLTAWDFIRKYETNS